MRLILETLRYVYVFRHYNTNQIKENIKVPRQWPLFGKSTGDRWILLKKDQQRGKCFHLMTSSSHWSGKVMLTKFLSMVVLKVVILTIPRTNQWIKFVNMAAFPFQYAAGLTISRPWCLIYFQCRAYVWYSVDSNTELRSSTRILWALVLL